jgi:hypothetical protein
MGLEQELAMLKQAAREKAAALNLDAAIRTVAKSGDPDAARINWKATFGGLEIRATFGAGTNSASVRLNRELVYESLEFGRYLKVFRDGTWVETLLRLSDQSALIEEARPRSQKLKQVVEEIKKFLPIDE